MFVEQEDEKYMVQFIYKCIHVQNSIDLQTFLKEFFHHIIMFRKEFVDYRFLNIAETVVHEVNEHDCIVQYFVCQLSSFHKNRKLKCI